NQSPISKSSDFSLSCPLDSFRYVPSRRTLQKVNGRDAENTDRPAGHDQPHGLIAFAHCPASLDRPSLCRNRSTLRLDEFLGKWPAKCSHVNGKIFIDYVTLRRYIGAMYIESVPNRNSPPAILLRESFRDGAKIKKRTIANLSDWPAELVEGLRTLLKGGTAAPADGESIIVRRALPHGHVAAALGTLRAMGLDRFRGPAATRPRVLAIAMIVVRLIAPASKLAPARMLDPATAASSLGDILGLGAVACPTTSWRRATSRSRRARCCVAFPSA